MKICSAFDKSTTTGLPDISCPKARVKLDGDFLNAWEDKISVNLTIFLLVFGISIPTKDFPEFVS